MRGANTSRLTGGRSAGEGVRGRLATGAIFMYFTKENNGLIL